MLRFIPCNLLDFSDEETLYGFALEMLEQKYISDETYVKTLKAFGEIKLVDLIATLGYYSYIAMISNTFKMSPKEGSVSLAE